MDPSYPERMTRSTGMECSLYSAPNVRSKALVGSGPSASQLRVQIQLVIHLLPANLHAYHPEVELL